ncbi:calmodulin-binding transcription activator 1-like [Balaenoptera ricei]|uniref:calmodulin-binding transcription activator 1-like n=1 Tax=Balaenoptera ricei TaxID=2746895 RepID=UPI0028BD19FA|nr:calmodulin-binding transcription activator 1-like [Balaenoptera ricei]
MEIHLNTELSSGLGRIWGWASCPASECGTSAGQKEKKNSTLGVRVARRRRRKWRAEGKWLPKTSRKSVSRSVFCGTSTYRVLNTAPPIEDDHGNSDSSHVKIFLPKKLLECLPKCSSLPKERHRWNTNERS